MLTKEETQLIRKALYAYADKHRLGYNDDPDPYFELYDKFEKPEEYFTLDEIEEAWLPDMITPNPLIRRLRFKKKKSTKIISNGKETKCY